MKPSLGRIVIYHFGSDQAVNNGEADAPAVIVRVYSDTCVNLRILCDGNAILWKGSVQQGHSMDQWSWPVKIEEAKT
jgi:hypothetical protein